MASRIVLTGCTLLVALILAAGCTGTPAQQTAAIGDNVTVEYTGSYLNARSSTPRSAGHLSPSRSAAAG